MNHRDETNGPDQTDQSPVISTANSGLACLSKQREGSLRLFYIAEQGRVGQVYSAYLVFSLLNAIKEEK